MDIKLNGKTNKDCFLDGGDKMNMYGIYQLKNETRLINHRFTNFEMLSKEGNIVSRDNYDLVYAAPLFEDETLEMIYTKFNIDHPADFRGHSLAVSDIIVTKENGNYTANYVDSYGYKVIPDFMKEQAEIKYEPTVSITETNHPYFVTNKDMSFSAANETFFELDTAWKDGQAKPPKIPTSFPTKYQIFYVQNGEYQTYEGQADIGSGDGSIISNIRKTAEFALADEKGKSKDYKEYWHYLLDSFVPYLVLHSRLASMDIYSDGRLRDMQQKEKVSRSDVSRMNYFEAIKRFVKQSRHNLNYNSVMSFPQFPKLTCELNENERGMLDFMKTDLVRSPRPVAAKSDELDLLPESDSEME